MQNYNNSYGCNSHEMVTALRDIVDVLYDGNCKVLKDDELCSTVHKKMKELRQRPERERQYKMFKIMSILSSSQKKMTKNCNLNKDVVISILDEINILCLEFLKNLHDL